MVEQPLVNLPRYDAYKDSGIEWLGEVPVGWELSSLSSLLNPISIKNRPDLPLLSITREKGVILRDVEDTESNHNFIPDDLSNYKVLRKGQFGMNKMKAWQGSYGVSDHTGIVSPAYFIFNLAKSIAPDFFHFAIRCKIYVDFFASASDGVRVGQWDLSKTRMKVIPFAIPSLVEQQAIAVYLDKKIARIDQAVVMKERQIELLKERRQILIQQAVTRGLDPDATLKDSGVDWIGEVPAHWEVVSNRSLFEERVEPGREGLPLLMVSIHSGVSDDEVSEEDNIRGRVKIEDKSKYNVVQPDDIVFNMMRAWQGAIGAVKVTGMVSPAYIVAMPIGAIVSAFFEYQYRSPAFIQQMDRYSKGITDFRKRLYWDEFKQLKTVLPPVAEQNTIVAYIESESAKLNQAITLQQQQIDKLKEFRATLINSVVTGKVKVPPA